MCFVKNEKKNGKFILNKESNSHQIVSIKNHSNSKLHITAFKFKQFIIINGNRNGFRYFEFFERCGNDQRMIRIL